MNLLPWPVRLSPQFVPKRKSSHRRDPTASGLRDAAVNRSASHNYFLLEKFEAGIALRGTEVKSIRSGRANLKDAYGLVKDGELWLINAHIGEYDHGNIFNHEPLRTRKLLVHRTELNKLIGKTHQKGLTLIPTRLYFRNGRVKVEMALAKGKQTWDKRETERRKTADKEAREAIARSRKRDADLNRKSIMNIKLATATASQIETECLVVAVVDIAEKNGNGAHEKPNPKILTDDAAVTAAAADLLTSGEVTAKPLEITLLHNPPGLKAKRLLLIGGGKAKGFSASELRKIAGAAVRTVKGKDLKSFAIVAPTTDGLNAGDAVKVIVEGAYVGSFDADYYKSDRKEQKSTR